MLLSGVTPFLNWFAHKVSNLQKINKFSAGVDSTHINTSTLYLCFTVVLVMRDRNDVGKSQLDFSLCCQT